MGKLGHDHKTCPECLSGNFRTIWHCPTLRKLHAENMRGNKNGKGGGRKKLLRSNPELPPVTPPLWEHQHTTQNEIGRTRSRSPRSMHSRGTWK